MEKSFSDSWATRCDSPQPELVNEIKDETTFSIDEVATLKDEVYGTLSDDDSEPDIQPSDFETINEIEDPQAHLHQHTAFRRFHDNGAINLPGVSRCVDSAMQARLGPALPCPAALAAVREGIVHDLPHEGEDCNSLFDSLLTLPQAVSSAKLSNHYYGFVSGGTLPIAEAANSLVGAMDLNVMVHDPNTSVAVDIEAAALKMLLQALNLPEDEWLGRTLTSGATGSNILALAAARDTLVNRLIRNEYPHGHFNVASEGLLSACHMVGIRNIKILSQKAHSSIYKTAGILGLGRGCVVECGLNDEPWRWDWEKVEAELSDESAVCIAVVGCGEVDTGRYGSFGDDNKGDMMRLHYLMHATKSQGWIHVDGAFGIFARALPDEHQFSIQKAGVAGLQYADSIGADAHKCLNVPYESAFLFTRKAESLIDICSNGSAAYLAIAPVAGIVSPLNTSLENSRRFRALPIYAVLLNLGRSGLAKLFASQILLARAIAERIYTDYGFHFELLPLPESDEAWELQIGIIVLFRAKDEELNNILTDRINAERTIFVSGTMYDGRKAVRIAVAGWDIDYSDEDDGDTALVCRVLDKVIREWKREKAYTLEVEEKIGMVKDQEINFKHGEFKGSDSDSLRSGFSNESEGGGPWREQEKTVKAWLANDKGFLLDEETSTSSTTETPLTLEEVHNTPLSTTQMGKRPSIVYVGDIPYRGLSGQGTAVPTCEAAQMRRAFDMGVPSFLEADVGLDGGLEPKQTIAPRCERDRERARVMGGRSPHSPHTLHASRTPVVPHSPLLAPEVAEEAGLEQLDGASDILSLTEMKEIGKHPEPKYHEYVPKRREGKESIVRTPGSRGSRSLEDMD